jgi:glycosyltransferase involved in cell wall biosynthesis
MDKTFINKYIANFLRREFDLDEPYLSNGELEQKYITMNQQLIKQDLIIKLISRQRETNDKTGLRRILTELNNTFWRFIIGDPNKIYTDYYKNHILNERRNNFRIYSASLKSLLPKSIQQQAPRLFIDVTSTSQMKEYTGIQRVVYELCRSLNNENTYPILIDENGATTINKITSDFEKVTFQRGDILFMPDAAIDNTQYLLPIIEQSRKAGGVNITLIYDLIPLEFPLTCGAAVSYKFKNWFKTCAINNDIILCNTITVRNKISSYLAKMNLLDCALPHVEHFELGTEIKNVNTNVVSDIVLKILEDKNPIFLSVGTIEPRKGYAISIEAIQKAWAKRDDFLYVIVGRYGWNQSELCKSIVDHDQYEKKLFWLKDINDYELSLLYKHAHALIFPSIEEGFGLPIIEAAQLDLPLILSDIDVFREIAGTDALYFNCGDVDSLTTTIIAMYDKPKTSPKFCARSWDAVASDFLEKISRKIEASDNP